MGKKQTGKTLVKLKDLQHMIILNLLRMIKINVEMGLEVEDLEIIQFYDFLLQSFLINLRVQQIYIKT